MNPKLSSTVWEPTNRSNNHAKFKERKTLEALLDPAHEAERPLQPGIEVLQRRSREWASTIVELKACAQAERLSVPLTELAASHMHMHANRLLRSAQRAQEMVIYDFLARLYESQLARTTERRTLFIEMARSLSISSLRCPGSAFPLGK